MKYVLGLNRAIELAPCEMGVSFGVPFPVEEGERLDDGVVVKLFWRKGVLP